MNLQRTALRAALMVAVRPRLWTTAARQFRRFVPDRWWRTRPFLPLPDSALLAFRAETQYGDATHLVDGRDLVLWLAWCKNERKRSAT